MEKPEITKTTRRTHSDLVAAVLRMTSEPMSDVEIVAALDGEFPGWTRAKDHAGKVGIVHRVMYKELQRGALFESLGLTPSARFEMCQPQIRGGTRWRLRP